MKKLFVFLSISLLAISLISCDHAIESNNSSSIRVTFSDTSSRAVTTNSITSADVYRIEMSVTGQPTQSKTKPDTFEFIFEGLEIGSTVEINATGYDDQDNRIYIGAATYTLAAGVNLVPLKMNKISAKTGNLTITIQGGNNTFDSAKALSDGRELGTFESPNKIKITDLPVGEITITVEAILGNDTYSGTGDVNINEGDNDTTITVTQDIPIVYSLEVTAAGKSFDSVNNSTGDITVNSDSVAVIAKLLKNGTETHAQYTFTVTSVPIMNIDGKYTMSGLVSNIVTNLEIKATDATDPSGNAQFKLSVNYIPPKLSGTVTYTPDSPTNLTVGDSVTFSYTGDNTLTDSSQVTVSLTFADNTDMSGINATGATVGDKTIAKNSSITVTFNKAGIYKITDAHAELTGYNNSDSKEFEFNIAETLSNLSGKTVTEDTTVILSSEETLSNSITINGGTLTLKAKNGTATIKRDTNLTSASMFVVNRSGTLKIENNVTLDGQGQSNTASKSMVEVFGGTFELSGKITNGYAQGRGGGITIEENSTLTLKNGAEISDCKQEGSSARGGAIAVYESYSSITIEAGAKITNNEASDGAAIYGPGANTLTLSGGEISDNKATARGNDPYAIIKWGGTFDMISGTISGGNCSALVHIEKGDNSSGKFMYKNGTISPPTGARNIAAVSTDGGAKYTSADFNGTSKTINWNTNTASAN